MTSGSASMTVAEFIQKRVLPEHRPIVQALRRLMGEYAPEVKEVMSYGILAYRRKRIIALISPTQKGITFAFSRGASFKDRYRLLEGVGKVSKNVRIHRLGEFNRAALRYYLRQALELDEG